MSRLGFAGLSGGVEGSGERGAGSGEPWPAVIR